MLKPLLDRLDALFARSEEDEEEMYVFKGMIHKNYPTLRAEIERLQEVEARYNEMKK